MKSARSSAPSLRTTLRSRIAATETPLRTATWPLMMSSEAPNVETGGVLHPPCDEAAAILAKVVQEAGLAQSLVEGRILGLDGGDERSLELWHGNGGSEKIGKLGRRLWRRTSVS